jgi:Flp pilus assembly protein TadD
MSRPVTLQDALRLAMDHHSAGRLRDAESIYRQILQQQPNEPSTLHLLGVLAIQAGRADAAAPLIERAIELQPNEPLFHSNLAEAYRRTKRPELAEKAARRAIELKPALGAAHANLGVALMDLNRRGEAIEALHDAIAHEPANADAMAMLCHALLDDGDTAGAIAMGRRAIQFAPQNPVAHNNLAVALERTGQPEDAEAEYRKAFEVEPGFFQAYNSLGTLLRLRNDLAGAMQFWQKSLDANPNNAEAHWNLSLGYLTHGDYARGFSEYAWRFQCSHSSTYLRDYTQPLWDGSDPTGKTIVLYPEQGFGDVIQFARFASLVADRGAKVIMHTSAELLELMRGLRARATILGPDDELPKFDLHLPLLSVPGVLGTTLQTLPANVPYIDAPRDRIDQFANQIKSQPGKRIGLIFAGRATHPNDANRSLDPALFQPITALEGFTFFSLQKGDAQKNIHKLGGNVIDLSGELNDFADTAAAISNLDLLISVDTAAVHVAGAIGAKVWTLIPWISDWRWLTPREDSPWYPTMKLFWQPHQNSWPDVIETVANQLKTIRNQ